MNAAPALAERVAALVHSVRFDDLPVETIVACKRVLLDTLGCAIGALGCAPAEMMQRLVPDLAAGAPGATIIGSGRRSTTEGAALINGTLVRYLDFMDVYWAKDICHPSENI